MERHIRCVAAGLTLVLPLLYFSTLRRRIALPTRPAWMDRVHRMTGMDGKRAARSRAQPPHEPRASVAAARSWEWRNRGSCIRIRPGGETRTVHRRQQHGCGSSMGAAAAWVQQHHHCRLRVLLAFSTLPYRYRWYLVLASSGSDESVEHGRSETTSMNGMWARNEGHADRLLRALASRRRSHEP